MARCFCECHSYPGVYPPPCGVCGHDTREGRMVGGYRDGWEPNPTSCSKSLEFRDGVTCSPFKTAEICNNHRVILGLRKHAASADRFEFALRAIAAADESEHDTHEDCPGAVATEALKG